MLPELGEMLSKDNVKTACPVYVRVYYRDAARHTVTAAWIGKTGCGEGRKPLLLLGFGVLPIRGALTPSHMLWEALIAIQTLDGVANAIFGIVSILVSKTGLRGRAAFNVAAGSLRPWFGIGAAARGTTIGGVLIQHLGYRASFLGLSEHRLARVWHCSGSRSLKPSLILCECNIRIRKTKSTAEKKR